VASAKIEYSPDLIASESRDWLADHKDQPFFLYYAPTLPHANNEGGKDGMEIPLVGEYSQTDWPPQQQAHAAMISRLDFTIGNLLDQLKQLDLEHKTLVFFSSDNGPHREGGNDPDFNDSNGPLRGIKRSLTDGGIRVPFIARWPGRIKAGTTNDFVGGFQDIMPTLAELAGAAANVPKDIDGLSILPTLLGQPDKQQQNDYLYWAFYEGGGGQAARAGRWKAVQQPYHSPLRLYDLTADIGEEHDMAAEHPEIVARLSEQMKQAYTPSENWKFPDKAAAPKAKSKAGKSPPQP